jgi:hypothetical protein
MPHRTLLVSAVATIGLGIAAAPAAGDLGPPGAPDLDAIPKCVPARGVVCLPVAGGIPAVAADLAKISTTSSRRKGLGLPPARRLFGRRAKKLLAGSDRRFATRLKAGLKEPKAHTAASAKILRVLAATDSVRRGQARQTRASHIRIAVDACPATPAAANPAINSLGRFDVSARADYAMSTIARYGRRWIQDTIGLTVDVEDTGRTNRDAFYAFSTPKQGQDDMRLTRTIAVYDPRTGRTHGETTTSFEFAMETNGKVAYPRSTFDGWIERQIARESNQPDPHADDPLGSQSYLDLVGRFARYVNRRVTDVIKEAQANWRTPNRCVRLDLDGPAKVAPGGTAQIHGNLTPVGGTGDKEGLYGQYLTWDINYINGGSARNLATLPLDQAEPWTEYTAPSAPWPDSARPGLDYTATTKMGIAHATITFEVLDKLYFRMTGYNVHRQSVTAYGTHDIDDVIAGGPGPVVTVDPCTDAATCTPFFQLTAQVKSTFDGKVKGTPNSFLCPGGEFTYATSTLTQELRLGIAYDPRTADPARTSGAMIPEVGDIFNDYCGAHDFGAAAGPVAASVPRDEFLSGRPVVFTLGGSGAEPSAGNHPGIPVQWSLTGSVTVQRTQEDGSPLPGT